MQSVKLSQSPICCTCGPFMHSDNFFDYLLMMILFMCHSLSNSFSDKRLQFSQMG